MHPCQAKKKRRRVLIRERRKVAQALIRWVSGQNNELGAIPAHEVVLSKVSACLQEYRLWSMARSRRLAYRGP